MIPTPDGSIELGEGRDIDLNGESFAIDECIRVIGVAWQAGDEVEFFLAAEDEDAAGSRPLRDATKLG